MKTIFTHHFEDLISIENLLFAWQEFLKGKRNKKDVQQFQFNFMDNIVSLHQELSHHTYKHGLYQEFRINDPKPRIIHKASVRDRLLHHAVYRSLYPLFDNIFITDSYSCRNNKGMHRAIQRLRQFSYSVSKNNTKPCWVLKCDIKKFFHSIDQQVLLQILEERISDKNIMVLLKEIIASFHADQRGIGLPLGNLTSQLFCNIYMNEFDQFIKHILKVKYYIRYADDFMILDQDKQYLENLIPIMGTFLQRNLKLQIHPGKIFIKTLASGMDFLGWIHYFDHRILRTITKRRMFKRLRNNTNPQSIQSYFGMMSHGNTYNIKSMIHFYL